MIITQKKNLNKVTFCFELNVIINWINQTAASFIFNEHCDTKVFNKKKNPPM